MTPTPATYTLSLDWPTVRADAVQFALEELVLDTRVSGIHFPLGGEAELVSIDWSDVNPNAGTPLPPLLTLTVTARQADALLCALGQAVGKFELLILHARSGAATRPYPWLVAAQAQVWMALDRLRAQRDEQDGRTR